MSQSEAPRAAPGQSCDRSSRRSHGPVGNESWKGNNGGIWWHEYGIHSGILLEIVDEYRINTGI